MRLDLLFRSACRYARRDAFRIRARRYGHFLVPAYVAVPSTLQLYFQQVRQLVKCDAEDGRIVGHLLLELVHKKPKDLAHAIREFANRTAMLRECGFAHVGDMLVAMLAEARSDLEQESPEGAVQDVAFSTAEQASAIGSMLAASVRSSHVQATRLHRAVDSLFILRTMKMQHSWFVPMLEVLLVDSAESSRASIARRSTAIVLPQPMADAPSTTKFDSVVRPEAIPHSHSFWLT